ncbi:MAG: cyclic nucleotide-binding domain-containing protein, partial [Actinomycetota bacterium]
MAFLRQHHPFSELDEERLAAIGAALQIAHVPAGEAILDEGGVPAEALGLIRKGELELSTGTVVVDLLEPGDAFGLTSVMTGQSPTMTVRALEDTLVYLLPADVARRALTSEAAIASVWSIARQRVRAADAAARSVQGADP